MPTEFSSEEEVKLYVASYCGLNPDEIMFEEAPGLKVSGQETALAPECDDLTPEDERRIQARIDAQKGYKLRTPVGKGRIVIEPFHDGFCCWGIGENNSAVRI